MRGGDAGPARKKAHLVGGFCPTVVGFLYGGLAEGLDYLTEYCVSSGLTTDD